MTFGHVELGVDGQLRCLRAFPGSDPLTPKGTPEASAVYNGVIPNRSFSKVAKDVVILRGQRDGGILPDCEKSPPPVVVFSKNLISSHVGRIQSFLDLQATKPPRYCPSSKPGTMNCVTFALWVLKTCDILSQEFDLARFGNREYLPDTFYAGIQSLYDSGFFESRTEKEPFNGIWVDVEGSNNED